MRTSAQNVQMQVIHALTAVPAGVDHEAGTVFAASKPNCKLPGFVQKTARERNILGFKCKQVLDVLFRDKKAMYGRSGAYVAEGEHLVVLVDLSCGNLAPHDFAENAVVGIFHLGIIASGATAGKAGSPRKSILQMGGKPPSFQPPSAFSTTPQAGLPPRNAPPVLAKTFLHGTLPTKIDFRAHCIFPIAKPADIAYNTRYEFTFHNHFMRLGNYGP